LDKRHAIKSRAKLLGEKIPHCCGIKLRYLGWSPVLRGLLKRKRKSNAKIDENEDGARAAIIEEGIATWIFNNAKRRNFYESVAASCQLKCWSILIQISSWI
jgi:aryl-alcohol dehydrogenase-like predicted oxidoreductase